MAHNKTLAAQLYGEFKAFSQTMRWSISLLLRLLSARSLCALIRYVYRKDSAINDHIDQMRLSATRALLERRDAIIVASVSAIYGLGDPNAYMQMLCILCRAIGSAVMTLFAV